MQSFRAGVIDEGGAHEEAIEEDGSGREGELGQFEHYANLPNKVDAFAPYLLLLVGWQSILYRGRVCQLLLGEQPLRVCLGKNTVG